jgi:hypothetical protein
VLAQIASIIAPIFLCACVGFIWGRLDKPFDTRMVTILSLNLGMPALIFSTLTKLEVPIDAFLRIGGIYFIATLCALIFGYGFCRIFRIDPRTYVPVLAFSNAGNMGLPLSLFTFGEEGLALGICIFVVSSICGLTIGPAIFSGRTSFDVVYRNPPIYGILAALLFMATGHQPPQWLANFTEILGGMSISFMIISLGVAVSRIKVQRLARGIALSAVKLMFGFALGVGIAESFGLIGAERGVIILVCSMPVAMHNYLFAERFDRNSSEIAGMVLISTAMAYVTLPALLWFVL